VKLLFDHNLSPRLLAQLSHLYPDSTHVYLLGLDQASDQVIWEYARLSDFIVVTKDADYSDLSMLSGYPPKVIWIRRGNCETREIASLLRSHYEAIKALYEDAATGILTLF
jgi:predicted nuclease of predicted toxin-antitoxin system